ncbi:MAG: response regulator [Acidobacteriia bacterium]|nr:response regulator [Terriglobia bacterium]
MDKKRLLVVDGESQMGDFIHKTFSDHFDVLMARSGNEAIRRAVLDHPNCLLLDVAMPQMSSFMLCEILKSISQTKRIPIVLMGAKPRETVWGMAKEMGALDYIEPPFSAEKISKSIHSALEAAASERRRAPRVSMKIPIVIRSKDSLDHQYEVRAETVDVSRTGALMRLPVRIPIGAQVEFFQFDPARPGRMIPCAQARVVWNDDDEVIGPNCHGFEFVGPSAAAWAHKQ